ncbi:sn-glycerol-3-phosphate ABC transporter substrate-binding protein UgpB [Pelagibacteraceae bacterium]|nr:sn-glycerol-3-phosphate ABC transporter substrate-binding protein UgpB [Pelagibacteraceae bacterium]
MKSFKKIFFAFAIFALFSHANAEAKTTINWWHAFGGRLGELLDVQVKDFNASQDKYEVVHQQKGNYSETLNAGIAAFRAKQQPHLLMVFEVGTATMMAAKGATKPLYEVMAESGLKFNPDAYIPPVKGYYTTTDGKMLSLPYNASTPVLWINKDLMKKAGLNPKMSLKHWGDVGVALDAAKKAGISCGLTTAWQSWIHVENFSAYHDIPFATKANGFAGLNTELKFNSPLHVAHLGLMGKWAKEGKFFYAGRRNEGGANFRSGECMFFTESSAGYAGIKKEAKFDFGIKSLPYYEGTKGPQNTILGGASLWTMSGHSADEYKGVAALINFLSQTKIQSQWAQDTGYLPTTTKAFKATRSFYKKNPGTDIAGKQMLANPVTENSKGLRLGSFDQIRGIIDEELESIWTGKKNATVAMNSAVSRGNALLRRFERANK